jgi:hypothetical protein
MCPFHGTSLLQRVFDTNTSVTAEGILEEVAPVIFLTAIRGWARSEKTSRRLIALQ